MMRMIIVAVLLLISTASMAQYVTVYDDREEFEAQGHIFFNWDFSDMPRDVITTVEEPYTTHDVTYTSDATVIIIGADVFGTPDNLIGPLTYHRLDGDLNPEPEYEMLGWEMTDTGHYGGNFSVRCVTSAGTYEDDDFYVPPVPAYCFRGYIARPGVTILRFYFSGFGIYRPAITHVTLGIRANTGAPDAAADDRPLATWSALKALF